MKTKLRSLRKLSWSACRTERKKTLARGPRSRRRRGRRSRAGAGAWAGIEAQRHAAGLQRGAHRAPHVHGLAAAAAALLVAEGRDPPLQLGDRAVDLGEVLGGAGRQRPVELGERAGGGSLPVRSISARSSSRRRWRSNWRGALAVERGRSPSSSAPRPRACRPSARRMRCTSTPITPSARRGGRRRRSRAGPDRASRRRCPRRSPGGSPRAARRGRAGRRRRSAAPRAPCSSASASAARKKWRSKSSSKTRRSSWDLATVAASASRKSRGRSRGPRRAPRRRRGSRRCRPRRPPRAAPRRRRAAAPAVVAISSRSPASASLGRSAPSRELDRDPLGDEVDVGAVLDDDAHRLLEGLAVDVVGADQQQRPRPVDRLGDRGRLLQVELADHVDDLDQAPRQALVELGRVQADDLELALDRRDSRARDRGSGA